MKNLFNDMDLSERDRILEMHKKQGYSLSEQTSVIDDRLPPQFRGGKDRVGIPGLEDDTKQADYEINVPQVITIDGSLFKNGIADIDKNNTKYKDAVSKLKKLSANMSVNIIGGASKVGSAEGYNNEKLAMLRATNFIKAAQSDGVKIKMVPSGTVGKNTVKNSAGAESEQFVKIDFTKGGGFKGTSANDNTSTDIKLAGDEFIKSGGGGKGIRKFKMCLGDLDATEYMELLKRFKNKIKSRGYQ
jgi:hypothetical protein